MNSQERQQLIRHNILRILADCGGYLLPQPRLVIFGAGPVALALADLAARFDLHRTICAPGLTGAEADVVQDGMVIDTGGAAERSIAMRSVC
jgi:xanthine/CO dehydrogenase XdhC/CoxF family maturation factor